MSHTGMGSLPSHRGGPTAMLWERLRHASTAHTLQQKNLRRSRRLPAAAEAVPGGVRLVEGGDCPPYRNLPPHRMALVKGRGAAQPTSHESASGPGRRLWPRLHIHRIGNGAPARAVAALPETQKGPHTWLRARGGRCTCSNDLPRTSRSRLAPTGSPKRMRLQIIECTHKRFR